MEEILDKTIGRFRIIAIQYTQQELESLLPAVEEFRRMNLEYNENDDMFIGSKEDVAIGYLLSKKLRKKLDMPQLDCEANEETGYNLPEFSIYYNSDARSWCGKWTHSEDNQTYDESGVFFGLVSSSEPEYKQIQQLIKNIFTEDCEDIAIAILERKCIE